MTGDSNPPSAGQKLSKREVFSYGLPRFGSAAMFLAVSVYLAKFYTDTLLLAPALIGWTYMLGRLWDGFTDPIMGYISDGTKWRMGRRRPYFLISAIPIGIFYYLLWSPPARLHDWDLFLYATAMYLLFYTFWTIFSIPHSSLGAEMTMDYHERTILTGVREGLGVLGTLAGTLAPPIFAAILASRQKGYSLMSATLGIVTVVFIVNCFFNVKENPEFQQRTPIKLIEGLKVLYRNKPFRTLVVVFVIALIGNAFVPILTLYMADYVVKVPERIAHIVIVSYLSMAAVSIVFWTRLSLRVGKKEAWGYSLVLSSAVFVGSFYYHEGTWVIWIILASLAGFGYGATFALAYSMMADVIDLDELETDRRREGAYFGVWFFMEKGAVGVTAFIGLQALSGVGYVPNVEQPSRVFWTLKALYSILPAICFAGGYFLLRRYPIDQKEHARIRAQIEARKTEPPPA